MAEGHIRAGFYEAAGSSLLSLANFDPSLFTHLIFLPSSPLDALDPKLHDDDLRHLTAFAQLTTAAAPSCKALLALPFSFSKPGSPLTIDVARQHGFDGIHFTLRSLDLSFFQYCASWRQAAAEEGRRTSRRALLITASFRYCSPGLTVPTGQPLPLDWICLRGYHVGVASEVRSNGRESNSVRRASFTFSHTAVRDSKPAHDRLSIHVQLRTCLDAGMDPSTLVLGLALHGFSFQLKDPSVHGMHAPVVARGKHDTSNSRQGLPHVHAQKGSVAYRDVAHFIGQRKAKYCHDSTTQSAYCHHGTTWICYDDTFTIAQKVAYLKGMGLKGYALDALHEDTPEWHLSNAARGSLAAAIGGDCKTTTNNTKAKEFKGKHKSQSRLRREIIEHGVGASQQN